MFVNEALAQSAGAPAGAGAFDIVSLLPLVLIFVVFYFLLIRPQQKKMRDHREMISALKRGDKVITGGGIVGTIVKSDEGKPLVTVEVAPNIRLDVVRSTITDKYVDTPPPPANQDKPAAASGGMFGRLLGKK
ncbi:MAG TPA: preprotein translocase subunit YajC [Geminicoccus sp.]|jgi:preprotein translocase subunit YajC|uniref:preprotein translocase subunit YajC n=1 Tax=Geminicoccus sp. TaxID=2024832 RepID=UPI002E36160D|nr:preprotein translocase subunit YajC [Geminicoccus sp.]HEX2529186.1 preprotein translocase subunit YajC [Geminicoccus sp.]